MKQILNSLLAFLILLPMGLAAQTVTDDPEARAVFEEMDRRRDRITYEKSDLEMVIFDARNRTRNRTLRSFAYEEGNTSKTLLIFTSPANIRGTAFLTLSEGSDEIQKLYLPALERVQVISASEKSDRFMGSDFTYEDLGDQDPGDYIFEFSEKRDTSYVLRARKKEPSQYATLKFYIAPERYILQRVEYFNESGEMIKRLVTGRYEKRLDEVWRANRMVMYDLANDRKTTLEWQNRVTGEPIADWRFTERGLRRGL